MSISYTIRPRLKRRWFKTPLLTYDVLALVSYSTSVENLGTFTTSEDAHMFIEEMKAKRLGEWV